ncbi:unnamed protein product [Phytophthora fragariaefolia]|uniref:Unnamed protein product n=1 Tax=Phytophthora fragariaefolia TaxID=1490495 RepID=A0A9W6YN09_9STRA|nr:unnamed protein product [Phytophthora fragariaefolia]
MAIAGGGTYFTGDGTSYTLGHVSAGNCNFKFDPGVGEYYAALNSAQWDSTLNCGRCAEVSCADSRCSDTSSTVTVYIVDQCPGCGDGDLDLSPTVFKQLTGSDPSRYSIRWKFVDCPVSGNIQYCTKSGSSSSWLAVQPANFANGVASVKIANQDVTMVDSCYYFLLNGGSNVDMSAVDIELTSISGETVTETLSLTADNCTVGSSNFGSSTTQSSTSQTSQSSTSQTSDSSASHAGQSSTSHSRQSSHRTQLTSVSIATTTAPTPTNAEGSNSYTRQQQSEVSSFDVLKSGSSNKYAAGTVTAASDSSSDVSILQSSEAGVCKTPAVQQRVEADSIKGQVDQKTGSVDTKEATTMAELDSGSSSPMIVALVVVVVVGVIALVAVAYAVKKKMLNDKRADYDNAFARSFDNFGSPVLITATIVKI